MTHKRYADRHSSLGFHGPKPACFACYDSGIVTNGDRLVSEYLPDYDMAGIRHVGGSDLALICHCPAAREQQDETGKATRAGFRDGFGRIRTTTGPHGEQPIGADIAATVIKELHRRRAEIWRATEAEMNRVRTTRNSGDGEAVPWFIAEVKAQLQASRANAPQGVGSLQSLGSVMSEVIDAKAS